LGTKKQKRLKHEIIENSLQKYYFFTNLKYLVFVVLGGPG